MPTSIQYQWPFLGSQVSEVGAPKPPLRLSQGQVVHEMSKEASGAPAGQKFDILGDSEQEEDVPWWADPGRGNPNPLRLPGLPADVSQKAQPGAMGSVVQQDPGAPMAMPVYGYQSGGGSRWNQQYTQDQPFGYFGGGMNTLSWGPLAQSMNTMAGSGPGSLQGAMSQMWDVNRSNQAAAQANLDRQARLAAIDKIGGIMSRMMGGGGVGSGVQPYYDTMSRQRIL